MDAARLSAAKSSPMMETINIVRHNKYCGMWLLWHRNHFKILNWQNIMKVSVCVCAQCLQHLDVSVLGELVPRLCGLLKSGVGLGTKVDTHLSNSSIVYEKLIYYCWSTPVSGFGLVSCVFEKHHIVFLSPIYVCFLSLQGGCASVIVSLTVQCPQDLNLYSGKARIWDRKSVV